MAAFCLVHGAFHDGSCWGLVVPLLEARGHRMFCRDDEFAPLERSRFAARELLGVEPIELEGGHVPMLEQPEALAELFGRLLEDAP